MLKDTLYQSAAYTEALAEAGQAASKEYIKLFILTIVILIICLAVIYYLFDQLIQTARFKKQEKKIEPLRLARRITAIAIILITIAFLIWCKIYKTPEEINISFNTYNVNHINRTEPPADSPTETSNISLNLVFRKRIFKENKLSGVAMVNDTIYEVYDSSVHDSKYLLFFYEENNNVFPDAFHLWVELSKNFDICEYHISEPYSEFFIGPATTNEEAWLIYQKFHNYKP